MQNEHDMNFLIKSISRLDIKFCIFRLNVSWSMCPYISIVRQNWFTTQTKKGTILKKGQTINKLFKTQIRPQTTGALFLGLNLNRSKFRPPEMPIFLGLDLDPPKITFLVFDFFEIFRRV